MFASVSGMAACITWKAVGDLPVLYCRMRAGGRPVFLCSMCYSFLHVLVVLWWGALAGPRCIPYLERGTVPVEGVVVSCGPTQVAVEYRVAAGGLLVATWCSAFVVEVVVSAAAVSAFRDLVVGHAYIGGVAELKAVLAD